jgi:integrase
MASVTKSGNRDGYRIRFYCDKRLREIYVPGESKRAEKLATTIAGHSEALSQAKANNVTADPAAVAWANGTTGKLRDKLVSWGLADPINARLATDEGRLLGPFINAYIKSRSDLKQGTADQYRYCRKVLVDYFGEYRALSSITSADAERWRRWLLAKVVKPATDTSPAETMAIATVSKYVKRAKTMIAEAVKDRLLQENPFDCLKGGNESNSERHRFISGEAMSKVLKACPDADWRLIFTLARYCGMRCPSEVLGLRWSDVDWDAGRLRINSSKTGLRFCPIFPEVLPILSEAFEIADDGAEYCVSRYRQGANLGTEAKRIIERAGLVPWVKPFVNLRSSRRTELQERFPDHVINGWLGHSGAVAAKHYLQTTEEHWDQAKGFCSHTGSHTPSSLEPSEATTETKKPRKLQGSDGQRLLLIGQLATPLGLEPRMTEPKSVVLPITPRGSGR